MLSCLGTSTDLLDIPRQPTCMNPASYVNSNIIGNHQLFGDIVTISDHELREKDGYEHIVMI